MERLKRVTKQGEQETTKFTWKNLLSVVSKVFASRSYPKKIEKDLVRAGILMKGEEFLTLVLLFTFVPGIVLTIWTGDPAVGILAAVAGLVTPRLMVNTLISRRLQKFDNQICDALVIMANSIRAGFSLLQAMEMVSKEMPDPISTEFKRTLREMSLGTPTDKALVQLSRRVGSEDLELVITAVLIQRQVGGNLAEVFDAISHTIRERIRIAGEIKTLTAQGKISGLVVGLLPIFLLVFLFFFEREYVLILFNHPVGIMLVGAGLISQIIGFVLIRKVVDIRV